MSNDTVALTGWFSTDARNQVACPRCGAVAGEDCRTPSGRKYPEVHGDRTQLLYDTRPDAVEAAKAHGTVFHDLGGGK